MNIFNTKYQNLKKLGNNNYIWNELYNIHNSIIRKYHKNYNYKLIKPFIQIGSSAINYKSIDKKYSKTTDYKYSKKIIQEHNDNSKSLIPQDYCRLIPYIIDQVGRIIAIGDVHGDFMLVLSSLYMSNVINIFKIQPKEEFITINYKNTIYFITWTGEDTHVVQIGDQIDRCRPMADDCNNPNETVDDEDSDVAILYFFTNLNELAIKKKGMVISLLGNHELMNVNGNFSYVSYKGVANYSPQENEDDPSTNISSNKYMKGLEIRKKLFSRDQQELSKFLACTRIAAVIINKILFVHAGIIPKLAIEYGIKDINILLKKWLTKTIENNENLDTNINDTASYNNLPLSLSSVKKLFLSKDSILWTRIYGNLPKGLSMEDSRCTKYVLPTFKIYNIKGMIIGHTPQFMLNNSGINSTCDGKVWRIDDGMSKAFSKFNKNAGNQAQVLEITFNGKEPVYSVLVSSFISDNEFL